MRIAVLFMLGMAAFVARAAPVEEPAELFTRIQHYHVTYSLNASVRCSLVPPP